MAKNWRLAVCRSRLVLALLSVGMSWLLLNLTLIAFQKYQAFNLEQKIERINVGMSEEELIRIIGQPSSDEAKADSQDDQSHLRQLEYHPKWGPITSGRYRWWVVTLDRKADKIVEITPGGFGLVEVDPPSAFKWIAGVSIIGLALAIWMLVLRWCRRLGATRPNKGMA